MKIKRVNRGRNHWYVDEDTNSKVNGVTTIIGKGIPKPALINWAGNVTAEYAVDNWDELSAMGPATRLKTIQKARNAVRDTAAVRGTRLHGLAEPLSLGKQVNVPAELADLVNAYVQFLDDFDVEPVYLEAVVYSETNRHVGTLDLIADLALPDLPEFDGLARNDDGYVRCLLDIKTGKGIYGETGVQLAGYRYSEWLLTEDADGKPKPVLMPQVAWTGAVHVTADGYELLPVEAGPEQYEVFLHAQRIAEFTETSRDLVGEPVPAPYRETAPTADSHLEEVPF